MENSEKNPRNKDENQSTNSTHVTPGLGIQPGPHRWEASALITALSVLPKSKMKEAYFAIWLKTLVKKIDK